MTTTEQIESALLHLYAQHGSALRDGRPIHVETTDGQLELRLRLAHISAAGAAGPDFASVRWLDSTYSFTRMQRKAIAVLWQAMQAGTPDVHYKTILREVGSCCDRLRDLFVGHPAWGTMIQRSQLYGGAAGCYRLAAATA